jgi:hypothetical protein
VAHCRRAFTFLLSSCSNSIHSTACDFLRTISSRSAGEQPARKLAFSPFSLYVCRPSVGGQHTKKGAR